MPITQPTKIVDAFGHNAGPDFITAQIPETTTTPGAASFDQGFPPLTMTAPAAGGIPPFGQDMNGLLNQVTSGLSALQAGQISLYDGTYATAIGGYAQGAFVTMVDGSGFWLNLTAFNTTNPDTGGAGWVPIYSNGASVVAVSSGITTLNVSQSKKSRIAFTGALTGNVQVIFPANDSQEWLLNNLTTGPFTLTATTAGGTGVPIPQGGVASPTGVYCDTVNIQFTVSPLAVPIDQNPTPLTLAERTNAGYLLATYLSQNSPIETPVIGAVFVENSWHDGFLRKISVANFLAQVLPAVSAAAVVNTLALRNGAAQLFATYFNQSSPQESFSPDAIFCEEASDGFLRKLSPSLFIAALNLVTTSALATALNPYATSANPTLTGTVGVPTRAPGDNTANAASTAFVTAAIAASEPTSGSNANGFWYKLPNGIIEQYGRITTGGGAGPTAHTYPIPFPTSCASLSGSPTAVQGTLEFTDPAASATGFTFTNGAAGSVTCWRATGH